jgi:hypothetical protein
MITAIGIHHRVVGTLLMVLLASVCATAQPDLPRMRTLSASTKVQTKSGNISGRVVTESGQPVVNVIVYVRPATPEGVPVTQTTTNREGVFGFRGLPPGSYTVQASLPGYIPKLPDAGAPPVKDNADSVTFVFMKGGVITGTVTNSKGDPVVAIRIRVEMVLDESGRRSPPISYESVTDDRGVYRVYGLPSGSYIVAADGGANYSPTGVNAFAIDMPTYAPSSNRETANEISVRVGEESSGVDISYRGERGSAISGIVTGARPDGRGFSVTLTSLAEKGPRWDKYFQNPDGEFSIEGIPDGDYHLVAIAFWNDRDRGESESMWLTVRGADIEGVELTAAALATIRGTVVLKQLKEPVPECNDKRQPEFSSMTVTAWHRLLTVDAKKKPQFIWRSRGVESPNSQGNFTLQGLAASEYSFNVRLTAQQWYLQSVAFVPTTPAGKPTDATRAWTIVKPGDQLSGLTFTIAQGAALVRGQLTLAEGQTRPEKLTVYLVPAEARQAEEALLYFASPVNTEGNFWLHNIVPGRYWMLAQEGSEDTRSENSKLRLPDSAATRSSLRHAAAQGKIEIELKPCQDATFRYEGSISPGEK